MPRGVLRLVAALGLLGVVTGESAAFAQGMRPPPSGTLTPPFDLMDPTIVKEGAHLFQQNCTGYCHGKEGRLSRAPKLRGREFEPRYLYGRISSGFPPMPAYQTILSQEQIWKLVGYILSLRDAAEE